MTATFDNKTVMSLNIPSLSSPNGFVALGPDRFGVAYFDNLRITRADTSPAAKTVTPQYHQDLKFLSRMNMNRENSMVDREPIDLLLQGHSDKQWL